MAEVLEYRVKLRNQSDASDRVVFNVSPDLSESRTVNYKTVDPVHAPGQIYAYVNSTSRVYQLSGVKLISRTQKEAEENLIHLWRLRAWTLPAFGKDALSTDQRNNRNTINKQRREINEGFTGDVAGNLLAGRRSLIQGRRSSEDVFGVDLRGSPPQVLELSAYAHDGHIGNEMGHINRVPVVITTLNIPYPSDVDYFPTTAGVPMPSIMSIDISLAETHSPREYEKFSLTDFKRGTLRGF